MKKALSLLLATGGMTLFMTGCANFADGTAPATAPAAAAGYENGIKNVTLSSLPRNAAEMTASPEFTRTNPYSVAAFAVAAFCVYPDNPGAAIEMLNILKGPEPLSFRDQQFIRERLTGKDYLPRSYFAGATPDNNYTPVAPYMLSIKEQTDSYRESGYAKLFLYSSGASSPRPIKLRYKPSTGEWFLYSFSSVLSGVKEPRSTDPWQ